MKKKRKSRMYKVLPAMFFLVWGNCFFKEIACSVRALEMGGFDISIDGGTQNDVPEDWGTAGIDSENGSVQEPIIQESPVQETFVQELPVQELPAEEPSMQEPPIQETFVDWEDRYERAQESGAATGHETDPSTFFPSEREKGDSVPVTVQPEPGPASYPTTKVPSFTVTAIPEEHSVRQKVSPVPTIEEASKVPQQEMLLYYEDLEETNEENLKETEIIYEKKVFRGSFSCFLIPERYGGLCILSMRINGKECRWKQIGNRLYPKGNGNVEEGTMEYIGFCRR